MIILVGLTILGNIVANFFEDVNFSKNLKRYFVPYALLFIVSVIALVVTAKKVKPVTEKQILHRERLLLLYIAAMYAICGYISIFDQIQFNHHIVFSMLFVIIGIFVVMPSWKMWPLMILTILIMISATIILRENNENYFLSVIFYVMYLPLTMIMSKNIYTMNVKNLEATFASEKEAEVSKQLATQLKEMNERLEHLAINDALTNIPNRLGFNQYVESLEQYNTGVGYQLTTVLLDVDCFKDYNDYYGHLEGDRVLQEMGAILEQHSKRHGVYIARWGGEEFVALLIKASNEKTEDFCGELVENVYERSIVHERSVVAPVVTVSIGAWTCFIDKNSQIPIAVGNADKVLYEVKNSGRNHYKHRVSLQKGSV